MDNLGKYLGVPLLYSKVSKHTFDDIINKLNLRLNSWKASSLSLARRSTLVKSVLSSIPLYTMQTALLPSATCNAIDRKCKNFFWRDTKQTRKIHLLSWDKVGSSKKSGDLRIRHASKMNQALMMKNGWRLIGKKDTLWTKVLMAKYKVDNDVIPTVERKRNSSNLWKGIYNSWSEIQKHHIWRIGDGSKIQFWNHHWIPNLGALEPQALQVNATINCDSTLMNFLTVSRFWDVNKLRECLPDEVVQ
ncbi:Putative ribonuclease H protein [Arachis hypogaea]|nr:Putative ribonuclease H protein [Arachis hypogaea]